MAKMDLTTVNWRDDRITKNFIAEHEAELTDPESMSPDFLSEATTYCRKCENPFSEELVKRAGMWNKYAECFDPNERRRIIRTAAKSFGILLI